MCYVDILVLCRVVGTGTVGHCDYPEVRGMFCRDLSKGFLGGRRICQESLKDTAGFPQHDKGI